MRGIDRLREYVKDAPASSMGEMARAIVAGMADEIEREVAGMVPLPVDADGVPIHVGDVMEWPDCSTAEVVGIGDDRFFYVDDGLRYAWASDKIHHHALTVEDVLREFANELWNSYCIGGTASDSGVRELEAKYVARLRLAGEDE